MQAAVQLVAARSNFWNQEINPQSSVGESVLMMVCMSMIDRSSDSYEGQMVTWNNRSRSTVLVVVVVVVVVVVERYTRRSRT
jgi:hypothetical protein